jgi:hypothetical protein
MSGIMFRTWFPFREWRFESSLRHLTAQGVTAISRDPLFVYTPFWSVNGVYHWGCIGFASLVLTRAGGVESATLEDTVMAWLEQHPTSGCYKICFR